MSGGTPFDSGLDEAAPRSRTSAPSATSARPCAIAATGSRYFAPSENESSVMLRMPRIVVMRRGGRALAARLWLGNERPARRAGCRHAWSGAAFRRRLFIRRADRLDALHQAHDFIAGEGLI